MTVHAVLLQTALCSLCLDALKGHALICAVLAPHDVLAPHHTLQLQQIAVFESKQSKPLSTLEAHIIV